MIQTAEISIEVITLWSKKVTWLQLEGSSVIVLSPSGDQKIISVSFAGLQIQINHQLGLDISLSIRGYRNLGLYIGLSLPRQAVINDGEEAS